MPKTFKVISIIIFFISLFPLAFSQAQTTDSIRFVTYYPSPYGSYAELRSKKLAVGSGYINAGNLPWVSPPPPCSGNPNEICGADLVVEGKVGIGTTQVFQDAGEIQIASINVPLGFRETDQIGRGSLWRMPLDNKHLRFDVSLDGVEFGEAETGYIAPLDLYSNGNVVLSGMGGDVGIGTTEPGAKLEVNGQVKITGGSPGIDKVLTSDVAGLASWKPAGGGWHHSGTKVWVNKALKTSWQVLDLSSWVGSRNALVFLKVVNYNAGLEIHVRSRGDTERDYTGYPGSGATEKGGGTSGASISSANNQMAFLLTETDNSGFIELKVDENDGVLADIYLVGYIN